MAWTDLMWSMVGYSTEPPGAFPGVRYSPRAVAPRSLFTRSSR